MTFLVRFFIQFTHFPQWISINWHCFLWEKRADHTNLAKKFPVETYSFHSWALNHHAVSHQLLFLLRGRDSIPFYREVKSETVWSVSCQQGSLPNSFRNIDSRIQDFCRIIKSSLTASNPTKTLQQHPFSVYIHFSEPHLCCHIEWGARNKLL